MILKSLYIIYELCSGNMLPGIWLDYIVPIRDNILFTFIAYFWNSLAIDSKWLLAYL